MWNEKNFSTVLDAPFMLNQFKNHQEIVKLSQTLLEYISAEHPYPDKEMTSLTSLKTLNLSQSFSESQEKVENKPRKISASILASENVTLKEHALVVSRLFVILNQLMSFDTTIFSNEIMELFKPLTKILNLELKKILTIEQEEIVKVVAVKDLKVKLTNDFFNLLWSFLVRLLYLVKVNCYAIISCSRNKGILLTDTYISKVLNDLFFLLSNITKLVMINLKNFVEELFAQGINFDELLGLKLSLIHI